MLSHPLGRLRLTGMLEGLSFILLLGVGMPLKYMAGEPMGVKVLGPAHGLLFVAYVFLIIQNGVDRSWSVQKGGLLVLASLLPFGPFIADRYLKAEQHEDSATQPSTD